MSLAINVSGRLDAVLVEQGAFPSRARAQAAIRAGLVAVDGVLVVKPSQTVKAGGRITVTGDVHPYVSRGGMKLAHALAHFDFSPAGKYCLDLGASTGGFSDVLLRGGAKKIYAVDVGSGQLHDDIAGHERVTNLEKTHAKDLGRALVADPIDLLVCDLSFISLKKALSPAMALVAQGGYMIALVKPQFEVGRDQIGKGGLVIARRENQEGVAEDMAAWIEQSKGWRVLGYTDSPISGGDGNREFLIAASKEA